MSQFPHDKFAKDLFDLLLTPLGNVTLQRTIQPEAKLQKRVGDIAPEVQTQIEALALDRLELLGETLLGFTNVNDLDLWLNS